VNWTRYRAAELVLDLVGPASAQVAAAIVMAVIATVAIVMAAGRFIRPRIANATGDDLRA